MNQSSRARVLAFTFSALATCGAIVGAGAVGCSSSKASTGATGNDATTSSGVGTVTGFVTDLQGNPVAGVVVSEGKATATSDSTGAYSLTGAPASSGAIVAYAKSGYLLVSERLALVAGETVQHNVELVAMGTAIALDATAGGTVQGPRGSTLTAPPGAFVDAQGQAVTGTVSVFLNPLDPAVPAESAAYPSPLVGTGGPNGKPGLLQSYGLLEVTVQQNGQSLQVASGKALTITVPATATGDGPATSQLWAWDQTGGLWDNEGSVTLANGFYTGTLHHLCWHTVADEQIQAACFWGRVLLPDGTPMGYPEVVSTGTGMAHGAYTSTPIFPNGFTPTPTGDYCIWGEPGATSTLTATYTINGKVVTGTLVPTNEVIEFPDPSGVAMVGSCATTGPTSGSVVALAGCQHIGDLVIGQNGDGGLPTCSLGTPEGGAPDGGDAGFDAAAANPFTGTCAAGLESLFNCFNPSGSCSVMNANSNGDASFSATLDYSSGSSLQILGSGVGSTLSFYGPGEKLCGTGQSQSTTNSLALTLPGDGGTYVLSGSTIICPNNTIVTLSGSQMQSASCTIGLADPSCTLGGAGDSGAGTGGNVSCYFVSGSSDICLFYTGQTVAQAQQDQATCNEAKGTLGSACPTNGQVGCCDVPSSGTTTCYYSGAAGSLQEACSYENGTWTAN